MAEKVRDSLDIVSEAGGLQTTVSTTRIHVGRAKSKDASTPLVGEVIVVAGTDPFAGTDQPARPVAMVEIGDKDAAGGLTVRDSSDAPVVNINGATGTLTVGSGSGSPGKILVRGARNGPAIMIDGTTGLITCYDEQLNETLVIDAVAGDIRLLGADCAEDFDVATEGAPGAVMCLDGDGLVRPCEHPYDRRAVGIVSGAGTFRPALRLDKRDKGERRQPVALMGKVFCLVDADQAPIAIGDPLTTSTHRGYAMLAADPSRSAGSIIGKSLGNLGRGVGLLPVLVTRG